MPPKRILVIDGNPNPVSLCNALAKAYAEGAESGGAEVRFLALHDLRFPLDDPLDYGTPPAPVPDLETVQNALAWCEHLVIVHPLWWGAWPARLKGLIDRTLMPGFAFRYVKGRSRPEPLLAGRSARVVVTTDTPVWYLYLGYGAAAYKIMKRQILGLCGFRPVRFTTLSPVRASTPERRAAWIAKLRQMGRART